MLALIDSQFRLPTPSEIAIGLVLGVTSVALIIVWLRQTRRARNKAREAKENGTFVAPSNVKRIVYFCLALAAIIVGSLLLNGH
ncbi:MAG: hypothetical protein ABJB03_02305 [Rhodoglobus sp.]